jgi:hypothetical protein
VTVFSRPACLALAALVCTVCATVAGAQTLSASASVTPARGTVGQTVTYTLTVRGGTDVRASAPAARDGLRLRSPRPTLDRTARVNGRSERTLAWTYEAVRPGTGVFGSVRVEVDRSVLQVDEARIPIAAGTAAPTPGQTAAPPAASDLFVRAEPSRRTAFVGQQVVVDYVLYFEPHLQPRQTAPIGTWDAPGFWREELDIPSAYPRPVTLGGKTYEAVTIRRMALFPTRSGTLSLAPMQFSVDLLRTTRGLDDDPFAPFFSPFSSRYEEEQVSAPAASLAVEALPAGAPAGFDGAVGQFSITSDLSAQRVRVGDPIQVRIALRGSGNLATIAAPDLAAPRGFDLYDATSEQDIDKTTAPLEGVKTFTYTLVPQGGGAFEVPPVVWSYFDPADGQYKTLRSEVFPVEVEGPPLADTPAADPSDPNAPAPLLTDARWRRSNVPTAVLWGALGAGVGLPALALLVLAGVRGRGPRRPARPRATRPDTDRARRFRAAAALDGGASFAETERIMRGTLAERFSVSASLPRPDFVAALTAGGAPGSLVERLDAVLERCERGQFAPGLLTDAERASTVREAEDVLTVLAPPLRRRRFRRARPAPTP